MIIGIYKRKLSEVNSLKFYLQVGSQEVGTDLPDKVIFIDDDKIERECFYDAPFSKEVGHHVYAYEQIIKSKNTMGVPSPIDFNNTIRDAETKEVDSDSSSTGNK